MLAQQRYRFASRAFYVPSAPTVHTLDLLSVSPVPATRHRFFLVCHIFFVGPILLIRVIQVGAVPTLHVRCVILERVMGTAHVLLLPTLSILRVAVSCLCLNYDGYNKKNRSFYCRYPNYLCSLMFFFCFLFFSF
jgi:hypothetical protein